MTQISRFQRRGRLRPDLEERKKNLEPPPPPHWFEVVNLLAHTHSLYALVNSHVTLPILWVIIAVCKRHGCPLCGWYATAACLSRRRMIVSFHLSLNSLGKFFISLQATKYYSQTFEVGKSQEVAAHLTAAITGESFCKLQNFSCSVLWSVALANECVHFTCSFRAGLVKSTNPRTLHSQVLFGRLSASSHQWKRECQGPLWCTATELATDSWNMSWQMKCDKWNRPLNQWATQSKWCCVFMNTSLWNQVFLEG